MSRSPCSSPAGVRLFAVGGRTIRMEHPGDFYPLTQGRRGRRDAGLTAGRLMPRPRESTRGRGRRGRIDCGGCPRDEAMIRRGSTAPRSPRPPWRASSSATSAGPSPAPTAAGSACSCALMAAPSSSTRSATWPPPPRRSSAPCWPRGRARHIIPLVRGLIRDGEADLYQKVTSAVDRVVLEEVLRHVRGNQVRASEVLGSRGTPSGPSSAPPGSPSRNGCTGTSPGRSIRAQPPPHRALKPPDRGPNASRRPTKPAYPDTNNHLTTPYLHDTVPAAHRLPWVDVP